VSSTGFPSAWRPDIRVGDATGLRYSLRSPLLTTVQFTQPLINQGQNGCRPLRLTRARRQGPANGLRRARPARSAGSRERLDDDGPTWLCGLAALDLAQEVSRRRSLPAAARALLHGSALKAGSRFRLEKSKQFRVCSMSVHASSRRPPSCPVPSNLSRPPPPRDRSGGRGAGRGEGLEKNFAPESLITI